MLVLSIMFSPRSLLKTFFFVFATVIPLILHARVLRELMDDCMLARLSSNTSSANVENKISDSRAKIFFKV